MSRAQISVEVSLDEVLHSCERMVSIAQRCEGLPEYMRDASRRVEICVAKLHDFKIYQAAARSQGDTMDPNSYNTIIDYCFDEVRALEKAFKHADPQDQSLLSKFLAACQSKKQVKTHSRDLNSLVNLLHQVCEQHSSQQVRTSHVSEFTSAPGSTNVNQGYVFMTGNATQTNTFG